MTPQRDTSRRDNIVTGLAILVIAATIPFAIIDTIKTGRVHLFSSQFWEELPRRIPPGPDASVVLQPTFAMVLGIRGGRSRHAGPEIRPVCSVCAVIPGVGRIARARRGGIRNLLAMGIIADVVFQLVLYREAHPGAALVVGPILICLPYITSRALTNRVARRLVNLVLLGGQGRSSCRIINLRW